MATIPHFDRPRNDSHDWADDYLANWKQFFDDRARRQLADEESFAWTSVTGVLITIVTIGLAIAVLAVALSPS